jgi:hypothetical protein
MILVILAQRSRSSDSGARSSLRLNRDVHLIVVSVGRYDRERQRRRGTWKRTIYSAMGIDWTTVRHDDPLGRGFEYVPTTGPIQFAPLNDCSCKRPGQWR